MVLGGFIVEYYLLKVDEYIALVEKRQAKDIKNELVDLAKISDLLGCEMRFDCINLQTKHVQPRAAILIDFVFSRKRTHKIALICKRKVGSEQYIYMGSLFDYKNDEMDGSHYFNFFDIIADFYNSIQDLLISKLKDINLLLNEALDQKEREWFLELSEKKSFLESKIL
jgi:hypothetical protein